MTRPTVAGPPNDHDRGHRAGHQAPRGSRPNRPPLRADTRAAHDHGGHSPSWLSTAEVAQRLKIDVRTVRWMIEIGQLPAAAVGRRGVWRIDPLDLESLKTRARARRAA